MIYIASYTLIISLILLGIFYTVIVLWYVIEELKDFFKYKN